MNATINSWRTEIRNICYDEEFLKFKNFSSTSKPFRNIDEFKDKMATLHYSLAKLPMNNNAI